MIRFQTVCDDDDDDDEDDGDGDGGGCGKCDSSPVVD